ncbi:integrase, catalytic region, zinc finger, CCHC-type containing protein [Tanacetum coccineum]
MSTSNTHQQSLADAGYKTRPPMLERGSYIPWASRFRSYLNQKKENKKWLNKAIDEGPYEFKEFTPSESEPPRMQKEEDLKGDDLKHYEAEIEAMNLIIIAIPNDIYYSMDACTTAQAIWQRVERLIRGTVQNKVEEETRFNNEFDHFVAELGEALVSVYNRFAHLMNDLERNGIIFLKVTVNTKFLNCLQPEWLKAKKLEKSHDPLALVAHTGSSSSSRTTPPYYVTHPSSVVDYDWPSYDSAFLSEVQTLSTSYENPLFAKYNQKQKYPKQPKIINNTLGDDQIDRNIIFDEPNRDVNSGSIEYDNNVQESYELEQLARNHEKERQKCESSLKNICETSWISKMEKLESENVSLEFQVQSLIKERENVKSEYQKLFDSIKKTRTQTQVEINELIEHVNQKTYAYAEVRAQNQDLLITISELKAKMQKIEKELGMYKVTKQKETNTKRDKSVLPSTRLSVASSVKRPLNTDSPLKNSVLSNTKKSSKKVKVSVRTNKMTYVASKNVVSNKKIVTDMDVENALKAKDVLYVSCAKNVLIPCHDQHLANNKLNVHSKVRRALFTTPRIVKSKLEDTTPVVSKTRFFVKTTQSKSLDTNPVVSKTKIAAVTPLSAKNKVVQIVLWIVDSGCSKHMTGDQSLLKIFVEKFMGTVHFGNDHFAAITGYGDYVQSNITSWLWHRRLSHLNFGTINDLTKHDLVDGLPKFKYGKDHLCSACERGKSKKASHPPKVVPIHNHEDSHSISSIIVEEHEAPPIITTSEEQTSLISLDEADEFNQEDSTDFDGNTVFVPYDAPNFEEAESSTTALDLLNLHEFHQVQPSTHI